MKTNVFETGDGSVICKTMKPEAEIIAAKSMTKINLNALAVVLMSSVGIVNLGFSNFDAAALMFAFALIFLAFCQIQELILRVEAIEAKIFSMTNGSGIDSGKEN